MVTGLYGGGDKLCYVCSCSTDPLCDDHFIYLDLGYDYTFLCILWPKDQYVIKWSSKKMNLKDNTRFLTWDLGSLKERAWLVICGIPEDIKHKES